MNRSFEEYFVPMVFDAPTFERRFRSENVDAAASKLWFRGEELIGLVLIARRGWTSRVAAMGLVVSARGKGYGRTMLAEAVAEAVARGEHNLLLEVFTPNERARRLYERLGFRNTRQLVNFSCPRAGSANTKQVLAEADSREVARLLAREIDTELPWMIAPETLAALASPVRALHLHGKAFAIVREDPQRTVLLSVVVPQQWRRQRWATRLLQALEASYSDKPFLAYLVPEGAAQTFFANSGWQAQPLTLLEMVCPLRGGDAPA